MDSKRVTVEVDPHSEKFTAPDYSQRVASWNGLRNRCPVAWNSNYDGFWILSNYRAWLWHRRTTRRFLIRSISMPRTGFPTLVSLGYHVRTSPQK